MCTHAHHPHTHTPTHTHTRTHAHTHTHTPTHTRTQVCDFGFATLKEDTRSKTQAVGSVTHMPPEALDDVPIFSQASDVFSLAITMFELLSFR